MMTDYSHEYDDLSIIGRLPLARVRFAPLNPVHNARRQPDHKNCQPKAQKINNSIGSIHICKIMVIEFNYDLYG